MTRDVKCRNVPRFDTVVVEAGRVEYNAHRPHSSVGGLTHAEYAERWTINQPAPP